MPLKMLSMLQLIPVIFSMTVLFTIQRINACDYAFIKKKNRYLKGSVYRIEVSICKHNLLIMTLINSCLRLTDTEKFMNIWAQRKTTDIIV